MRFFSKQAGAQFFHFCLPRLVQIREFISPAERDQKLRLRDEPCADEARAAAPQIQRSEIDVRSQILFARRVEKIFRNGVIAVREQRAAIVMLVVQSAGFVAIIDGQDKAALQRAPRAFDPIARFEAHFRLLPFFERDSLLVKILLQRRHRRFSKHFGKSPALKSYEYFSQRAVLHDDAVRGQSVQQFI